MKDRFNNEMVIFLCMSIFFVLLFASCIPDGTTYPVEKCGDWEEIIVGEFIVQNNVWNKGDVTGYEQCIFKEKEEEDFPFGWHWYWPETDWNVKAYPEIIFGHKPWNTTSTTADLPVQISAITGITASYDIEEEITGSYNLAFDIWLTSTDPPTDTTIEQEIMIWLDQNELMPAGPLTDSPSIDGELYDFYKTEFPDWTYIAFNKKTPELSGETKIDLFFDYLVANGYVQDTEYCASIEIGNEIVDGSGKTTFSDFSVVVNSK